MVQEIIDWTIANGPEIVESIFAVLGAAYAIARLTPTQKDDKYIEKARKVFEFIANLVPDRKVSAKKKRK